MNNRCFGVKKGVEPHRANLDRDTYCRDVAATALPYETCKRVQFDYWHYRERSQHGSTGIRRHERPDCRNTSCIRQADEYFQASDSVSLATKPLVQFYGVQALAKAAILALDNQTQLVDLRYHGLSTRSSTTGEPQAGQLRLYSENPNSWTLEDEYAITNDGVFPHISAITGESVRNKGQVLKLKPLLRVVPEFGQLYERHYGEQHHTLYLYGEPELDQHGQFEIFFSVAKHDDILAVFPEFGNGFTEVLRHNNPGFGFAGSIQDTPNFGKVVKGTIAGKYFVRPTQADSMPRCQCCMR